MKMHPHHPICENEKKPVAMLPKKIVSLVQNFYDLISTLIISNQTGAGRREADVEE